MRIKKKKLNRITKFKSPPIPFIYLISGIKVLIDNKEKSQDHPNHGL